MGFIFSRFKKKSSVELLEDVHEEIKELEACNADTKLRQRKIAKRLMGYSAGFFVLASILLYFFFPKQLEGKIVVMLILISTPLLYYIISRLISNYYTKKIKASYSRLKDLQKEKKRLIEEILENETYKVAKNVLEKFAPEAIPQKIPTSFNGGSPPHMGQGRGLRPAVLPPAVESNLNRLPRPTQVLNQITSPLNAPRISNQPYQQALPPPNNPPALTFPRDKGYVERMFEYLIGEGPNNRYALICNRCSTHNGMALMEEFEYTAFKCYACQFLNPARKERPLAPKLESDKTLEIVSDSCSSSISDDQDRNKIEEVESYDVWEREENAKGDFASGDKEKTPSPSRNNGKGQKTFGNSFEDEDEDLEDENQRDTSKPEAEGSAQDSVVSEESLLETNSTETYSLKDDSAVIGGSSPF